MRVLQNVFAYGPYLADLHRRCGALASFDLLRGTFVEDRYCAVHYLEPPPPHVVELVCDASDAMQQAWVRQRGGSFRRGARTDILSQQAEEFRADVFYTQNPGAYGPDFLRRLPGCVKVKVGWQSPPAQPGNLTGYDVVVNNFPDSLKDYARQGVRTAYLTPSFDPVAEAFASRTARSIDVAFVGGYSQHHKRRAEILEAIAALQPEVRVTYALNSSRLTRVAESAIGRLLPLSGLRRPPQIQRASVPPVFGRGLYDLLSNAKIVLNGAVDSAGEDRGNMRCFEAMSLGAVMLTDAGRYPEGMVDGESMVVYRSSHEAVAAVRSLLLDPSRRAAIASAALAAMRRHYSRALQWRRFESIVTESW